MHRLGLGLGKGKQPGLEAVGDREGHRTDVEGAERRREARVSR